MFVRKRTMIWLSKCFKLKIPQSTLCTPRDGLFKCIFEWWRSRGFVQSNKASAGPCPTLSTCVTRLMKGRFPAVAGLQAHPYSSLYQISKPCHQIEDACRVWILIRRYRCRHHTYQRACRSITGEQVRRCRVLEPGKRVRGLGIYLAASSGPRDRRFSRSTSFRVGEDIHVVQKTVFEFWEKLQSYDPYLSTSSSESKLKINRKKVEWQLCRKDNIAKFKAQLLGHTHSIQMLLITIQM